MMSDMLPSTLLLLGVGLFVILITVALLWAYMAGRGDRKSPRTMEQSLSSTKLSELRLPQTGCVTQYSFTRSVKESSLPLEVQEWLLQSPASLQSSRLLSMITPGASWEQNWLQKTIGKHSSQMSREPSSSEKMEPITTTIWSAQDDMNMTKLV